MVDKKRIEELHQEMAKQKEIFLKHAPRAINPDGSDEYKAAKKAFDAADRRIKEIEKELVQLQQGTPTPPPLPSAPPSPPPKKPTMLGPLKSGPPSDRRKRKRKQKSKDAPPGVQVKPSQAKIRLMARGQSGEDEEEEV